jgi:Co/Zn/Cd efflux system component
MTSVMAILGLLAGRFLGWTWMDPVIGILGAVVIAQWSWSLIRSAGAALIDATGSVSVAEAVRIRLETEDDAICDMHLWRLGPGHQSLIVGIVSRKPEPPAHYKAKLRGVRGLSHVTVEVNPLP